MFTSSFMFISLFEERLRRDFQARTGSAGHRDIPGGPVSKNIMIYYFCWPLILSIIMNNRSVYQEL